jgi:ribonucleoside-diphosphate reductase alpha subunit
MHAHYVVKRDGQKAALDVEKITERLRVLGREYDPVLDSEVVVAVAQKTMKGAISGMQTSELDLAAARNAAMCSNEHPDYDLHKATPAKFSLACEALRNVLSESQYTFVMAHAEELDKTINNFADYDFDYFGIQTLMKTYLLRVDDKLVERPQYLYMRLAVFLHMPDLKKINECYDMLSNRLIGHATPSMYNAGTRFPQMASCYLLRIKGDDLGGIFETIEDCALISKYGAGLSVNIHEIRARGAPIKGTNGHSNGLIKMLGVFDATANYVDQGGGKRKGSFAIYLEPWHKDVESFVKLKRRDGDPETRVPGLFYALWVPDLFMERVHEDGPWTLFCPTKVPMLADTFGAEFEALYDLYESDYEAYGGVRIRARALMHTIIESQVKVGVPYFMYKDHCNRKSNQQHLGTIRSSNLCCEIVQYSSHQETAVCNLGAVNLLEFVRLHWKLEDAEDRYDFDFDFDGLESAAAMLVRNLDACIEKGFLPIPEAEYSNKRHRPLGIGVVGLQDVFWKLRLPYDCPGARELNARIFEALYRGAMRESIAMAKELGKYPSYEGSPLSLGVLQHDLWGVEGKLDWTQIRSDLKEYGARHSLLIALMPTASTSQIFGVCESFEPAYSNDFKRMTIAGDYLVLCKYLVKHLQELGLYTADIRAQIKANGGSIRHIAGLPHKVKLIYRTAWEVPLESQLKMAAERAPFICQSQSMNLHVPDATTDMIWTCLYRGWQLGLKCGSYYTRTQADVAPAVICKDGGCVL